MLHLLYESASSNNLIQGNRTVGAANARPGGYTITNQANAKVIDNIGFDRVDNTPWMSKTERDATKK